MTEMTRIATDEGGSPLFNNVFNFLLNEGQHGADDGMTTGPA